MKPFALCPIKVYLPFVSDVMVGFFYTQYKPAKEVSRKFKCGKIFIESEEEA